MSEGFRVSAHERTLHFKQPAGTSRGVYTTRKSWYVTLTDSLDPNHIGIGECAPLPDLSSDAGPDYGTRLMHLCSLMELRQEVPEEEMRQYPSMAFGLETALLHYRAHSYRMIDTPFARGEIAIPINGLVWMGRYDEMLERMQQKMQQGFHCVKLKIGAIDFDKELDLMRIIRSNFRKDEIEIRVDANGAFSPEKAPSALEAIAKYDVHSIEQPIRQGQWPQMAGLCRLNIIPIALDEELIGHYTENARTMLLDAIAPQYIVIKPSLHGGMSGTEQWVRLARERRIGSWITSALESNIGLNAIAQLTAKIYGDNITFPQGLGTGQLFTDNIELPYKLDISGGTIRISGERRMR